MSLHRLPPSPISREEFARFLRRCVPPIGWTERLAVGTSGGPDSTCLLFLIHRYLQDLHNEDSKRLPSAVVSLTVDHGMQDTSAAMAKHSADYAKALGLQHITTNIPWGTPPFPERPKSGEAFEGIARDARYAVLFRAMTKSRADVIALGHQGNDQVETSLMRLARGTTELGAGGMRRCRRWGMGADGGEGTLSWAGHEGMKRWIIRPLLEVSKDRMLATCDENKLEYIIDPTNFQPELTLRNAIREMVSKNTFDPGELVAASNLPKDIVKKLNQIQHGVASLESVEMDPTAGPDQLRGAVAVLSEQVEDIDSLVDSAFTRCHLPSPIGSYLVSYRGLSTIRDPLVKRALVLRMMRYVSFHAWGALRADGNRRRNSINRIIECLWTPDPFSAGMTPFTAGGGVLWTPVLAGFGLRIPMGPGASPGPGEIIAWLATRTLPFSVAKLERLGLPNPVRQDVTDQLLPMLQNRHENPGQVFHTLWDFRFVLRMDIDKIPDELAQGILHAGERVAIYPNTRWIWPKVVRITGPTVKDEIVVHSAISIPEQGLSDMDKATLNSAKEVNIEEITAPWVRTEWARSISAL
ncbi:PP-loop family-domain-containing protein [Mycena maculata]|uniref:tRNA(Ile)-lysidine synthetase n=1 Tax=Mycena maculata TaxID=230809 RepID=A0AAD7MWF4_9AGAR|nr:PP-loop family-domain-containing protein [Mycena maculata]